AARGGPKRRWRVNLKRRRAMSGPISVMFNTLANGGFCPASYRRLDSSADHAENSALIEEAIVSFAAAVAAAGAHWAKQDEEGERRPRSEAPHFAPDIVTAP